jgi:hypothetical protein
MSSKFVSILEAVGKDIVKDFNKVLPIAAGIGEAAVAVYAPTLSPMYNATVNAVLTAEKSAAVLKQTGTGTQKMAAVVAIAGPLISQGLSDAGLPADATAVNGYVNSVVTILKTTPAPAAA